MLHLFRWFFARLFLPVSLFFIAAVLFIAAVPVVAEESLFFYASNSSVRVFNSAGEEQAVISIPEEYRAKRSIFVASQFHPEDPATVVSLEGGGKNENPSAHIFSASLGKLRTIDLGQLSRNTTVLAFDFDQSGLSDLATLSKGVVKIYYDPGVQEAAPYQFALPVSDASYFTPVLVAGEVLLAAFDPLGKTRRSAKRTKTTLKLFDLNGAPRGVLAKVSLAGQPLHLAGAKIMVPVKSSTTGNRIYALADLESVTRYGSYKADGDATAPGHYFTEESELQVAEGEEGRVEVYDVSGASQDLLAIIALDDTAFDGQVDCNGSSGDTTGLKSILQLLSKGGGDFENTLGLLEQYSQECAQVGAASRSSNSAALLGGGVFRAGSSAGAGGTAGADKYGCDAYRNPNDGPNGFLWKASDHDSGRLVILGNVWTERGVLVAPNGKVIESLRYTGPSNGRWFTMRGSRSPSGYPAGVVVKVFERYSGNTVCWKINNPNGRVD